MIPNRLTSGNSYQQVNQVFAIVGLLFYERDNSFLASTTCAITCSKTTSLPVSVPFRGVFICIIIGSVLGFVMVLNSFHHSVYKRLSVYCHYVILHLINHSAPGPTSAL